MTKPSLRFVRIGVFLFVTVATFIPEVRVLHTGAAAAAPPVTSQTSTSTTVGYRDVCLNCHGPFDKLAATNAKYQAPSGEKISPHRYVPHSAKDVKAIPGCSNCHEPHPVPLTAGGLTALPQPDVQWCYSACHHKNNFVPCKDCHK
jgi:hypothetical protein